MRYGFHPDALEEYNQAGYYYARKEPGLDLRFIVAIEKAVDAILANPLRYRFIEEDVRRCLARVFPYAILYTIEEDYILIVAVAHCSREPGYWKHRLP